MQQIKIYSKAQKALNQINKIGNFTVEDNQELSSQSTSLVDRLSIQSKEDLYSQIKSYYSHTKSIKLVDCPVGDGGCFINIVETGIYGYEDEFCMSEHDCENIVEDLEALGLKEFVLDKLNLEYKKLCVRDNKEFDTIKSFSDCSSRICSDSDFDIKKFLLDNVDRYANQEAINKINDFTDCKIFNNMKYKSLYSPAYYNFDTDSWYCDIDINPSALVKALDIYKVPVEYLESLCRAASGWNGMDVRIWDVAFLSFGLTSWLKVNKGYEELKIWDWYFETDYSNYVEFKGLEYEAYLNTYNLLKK